MKFHKTGSSSTVLLASLLMSLLAGSVPGSLLAAAHEGSATDPSSVTLPEAYASDDWLADGGKDWNEEFQRREQQLWDYLSDTDPARAASYGFREGHFPALAWNWYDQHPVGYGGLPYVLLTTILSLDPTKETDPHLLALARIWKKQSQVAAEQGEEIYTLDHLGFGPHPQDYENGVAKLPSERQHPLPNGFVYDPTVQPEEVAFVAQRLKIMRDGLIGGLLPGLASEKRTNIAELVVLARGKLRNEIYGGALDYEKDLDKMQEPPPVDAVFFACSGCHQGRVMVGGRLDDEGKVIEKGRMHFMPGMPNTEIEAQYFSELLMKSGMALIESGYSEDATELPKDSDQIKPSRDGIQALLNRMLTRAIDPDTVKTIYGPSDEQVKRAQLQTYWVAKDFARYVGDLVGVAVKTQYIYLQLARKFAYNPDNPLRASADQPVPEVFNNRIGQMDAFGMASGLVAIHTHRKDQSYLKFIQQDNPENPLFSGIDSVPGFSGKADLDQAGERILANLGAWLPPVPAPIDIKSLNWSGHRALANWDGNQGAAARTLASGVSATGDPLKVNVRIHEPLNPLINNMPPPAYPFPVDADKARRGMAIFQGEGLKPEESCTSCHKTHADFVVPVARLGVDPNRSEVNTEVSRYGLAGLVMEACTIFMRKNPGNQWCLPHDADGKVITDWEISSDDYFKDTPGRVKAGTAGYKADMLHGIWARAPFLHNGSVPTLAHMLCPDTRPAKFMRGNIYYDQANVGFEWAVAPQERYSPNDVMQVKTYDTSGFGRANTGHTFGSSLCPDTAGLDPIKDRHEIEKRIAASPVADLLEYLKTL